MLTVIASIAFIDALQNPDFGMFWLEFLRAGMIELHELHEYSP